MAASRWTALVLVPLLFAGLIALRWSSLDNPPAWDSAISVFPAAITLMKSDFDLPALMEMPHAVDTGPNTHSATLVTLFVATILTLSGPEAAITLLHLVNLLLLAVLGGMTYAFVSRYAPKGVAFFATVATCSLPVMVQQASDIYLDLPVAVAVMAAVMAADSQRPATTAIALVIATWVKFSAIFALPALWYSLRNLSSRRRLAAFAGGSLLIALAALPQILATSGVALGAPGVWTDSFYLFRSSFIMLLLTPDIALLLVLFAYLTARSRGHGTPDRAVRWIVAAFLGLHSLVIMTTRGTAVLPRYYVAILPLITISVAILLYRRSHRVAIIFLSIVTTTSLINSSGDLYPAKDSDFYVVAERSTRAEDLIALHEIGARRLEQLSDRTLLVDRQMYFRLSYPEMQYVSHSPEDIVPVSAHSLDSIPDRFAMVIERRLGNPLVAIEELALEGGWHLEREDLSAGPYTSELILGTRQRSS